MGSDAWSIIATLKCIVIYYFLTFLRIFNKLCVYVLNMFHDEMSLIMRSMGNVFRQRESDHEMLGKNLNLRKNKKKY